MMAEKQSKQGAGTASKVRTPASGGAGDGQLAALLALLRVEQEVRDAASERDLVLLMVNETRKLTRARQIFVAMPGPAGASDRRSLEYPRS